MICFNNNFITEILDFWFNNKTPENINSHLIFAITTFIISLILVILNNILIKIKNVDILKLNITEKLKDDNTKENDKILIYSLWVVGSFLISFILTMTKIINITIISSVIVGFTWDKLFVQLSKITNNKTNPDEY